MDKNKELTGCLIRQNDEGLSISYWPDYTLPEEAMNWCRILVGTATTGADQVKVNLWKVGEYNVYSRAD